MTDLTLTYPDPWLSGAAGEVHMEGAGAYVDCNLDVQYFDDDDNPIGEDDNFHQQSDQNGNCIFSVPTRIQVGEVQEDAAKLILRGFADTGEGQQSQQTPDYEITLA